MYTKFKPVSTVFIYIVDDSLARTIHWGYFKKPLIFADSTLDDTISSFNKFGAKSEQLSQFSHKFHRDQTCLACIDHIHIFQSTHSI